MKITWTITKKRGNFRPVLSYTCTFEDWEKELQVEKIQKKTKIPKPDYNWEEVCLPGCMERGKQSSSLGFWDLIADPGSVREQTCRLPWRPGARPDYPEVEEGFRLLREAYEQALREAYDSGPFECTGELDLTQETKQHIAPGITAGRMLKVVGQDE